MTKSTQIAEDAAVALNNTGYLDNVARSMNITKRIVPAYALPIEAITLGEQIAQDQKDLAIHFRNGVHTHSIADLFRDSFGNLTMGGDDYFLRIKVPSGPNSQLTGNGMFTYNPLLTKDQYEIPISFLITDPKEFY